VIGMLAHGFWLGVQPCPVQSTTQEKWHAEICSIGLHRTITLNLPPWKSVSCAAGLPAAQGIPRLTNRQVRGDTLFTAQSLQTVVHADLQAAALSMSAVNNAKDSIGGGLCILKYKLKVCQHMMSWKCTCIDPNGLINTTAIMCQNPTDAYRGGTHEE